MWFLLLWSLFMQELDLLMTTCPYVGHLGTKTLVTIIRGDGPTSQPETADTTEAIPGAPVLQPNVGLVRRWTAEVAGSGSSSRSWAVRQPRCGTSAARTLTRACASDMVEAGKARGSVPDEG